MTDLAMSTRTAEGWRTNWDTVRSWGAVHATIPAVITLLLCAALTPVVSTIHAITVGLFTVPDDTPIGILLPVPLSAALALACTYQADARMIQLAPSRWRIMAAKAVWTTLALLSVIGVAALSAQLSPLTLTAVLCNQALCAGLALFMVSRRWSEFAWVPGLILFALAMTFGYRVESADYHWWAAILEPEPESGRIALSGLTLVAGLSAGCLSAAPPRS